MNSPSHPRPPLPALAVPALLTAMLACGCAAAGHATGGATQPAATAATEPPAASPPAQPAAEPNATAEAKPALYPKLQTYARSLLPELDSIPDERRQQLDRLAAFVQGKRDAGQSADLLFICTHNSRRSHMAQLWAAAAASYYGVDGVHTYSGGTESSAFNPRAVAAMRRAGFGIPETDGENPRYTVTFSDDAPAQSCFSKKYDDDANPKQGFAAVMTCAAADAACPLVAGASLRVGIPYVDPKVSDGTPEETATYDARARQIATEMFYLFSRVGG